MSRIVVIFVGVFWLHLCNAHIHFPEDNEMGFHYNLTDTNNRLKVSEDVVDGIIAKGVLNLTLSLAKYISATAPSSQEDNTVYAPINIAGALALLLLGSNGKTFEEISNVLGLAAKVNIRDSNKTQVLHEQFGRILNKIDHTSSFDLGEQVKLAAAIFVQDDYPIRSLYKKKSEDIYKSEVLNVDFKQNSERAKNLINAWASDRTSGKIKTILNENPPSDTKLVIVGALHFKAAWEKPFFPGVTQKKPFYTNGRKSKNYKMAEMMSNGGLFPYYRDPVLDCEIMGFPYKGNKTTMYVIMPNYSNKEKLLQLQNKLTPDELERLVDNTRYVQSVILFPKMKLESSFNLNKPLMNLGVHTLFNPRQANLALISPGIEATEDVVKNPIYAKLDELEDPQSVLIFSRFGVPVNCTQIFDPTSNISKCEEIDKDTNKQVTYKKFGEKVGRRISRNARRRALEELTNIDALRSQLTESDNPGLYADKVLHKVYMDITESGTEAAATTFVGLSRGGDITTFRVDVPFLFFIRSHDTKIVLFWGAVNTPTPIFDN